MANQMGIKYSMEGFIKYLMINTVGNSKRRFTDHKGETHIMIADDNMQINTVHVPQGMIQLMYI